MKETIILDLSAFYHDCAAALLISDAQGVAWRDYLFRLGYVL